MIVFIGIPLMALVRILNRLMRYFNRIESELRRLGRREQGP